MSPRNRALAGVGAIVLAAGLSLVFPVASSAVPVRVAIWHMGTLGADRHTMKDTSHSIPPNDGVATAIKVVPAFDGYGYRFNGRTSQVVVPDHDSLDPAAKAFSIVLHVKFGARPASGYYSLLNKGSGAVRSYSAIINTTGKPVCAFHGSLRTASVVGPNALADSQWHTIVCAKFSKRIYIMVDGVKTTSKVRIGGISNARKLYIGRGASGGNRYAGVMDEVTIRVGT
jgi:hypothetical protein